MGYYGMKMKFMIKDFEIVGIWVREFGDMFLVNEIYYNNILEVDELFLVFMNLGKLGDGFVVGGKKFGLFLGFSLIVNGLLMNGMSLILNGMRGGGGGF